jgi:hypothetical protein
MSGDSAAFRRARQAAESGDFEALRGTYPSLTPGTPEQQQQADQFRRILSADEARAQTGSENKVDSRIQKFQDLYDTSAARRFNMQAGLQRDLTGMQIGSNERIASGQNQTQLGIAGINSKTQLGVAGIGLQGIQYQTDSGERLGMAQNATQRYGMDKQFQLGSMQNQTQRYGIDTGFKTASMQNQTQRDLGSSQLRNEATRDRMNAWLGNRRGVEDVLKTAYNRSSFR